MIRLRDLGFAIFFFNKVSNGGGGGGGDSGGSGEDEGYGGGPLELFHVNLRRNCVVIRAHQIWD